MSFCDTISNINYVHVLNLLCLNQTVQGQMDPVTLTAVFYYMIYNHAKYKLADILVNVLIYAILLVIIIIFWTIRLADGLFLQQKNVSWYI
jgi:hypothetical protein